MKFLFSILMLLSFNKISFAQHNFGIKLNGGISRISNSFYKELYGPKPDWTIRVAPSGQTGIYYNLSLGKKLLLGTELTFTQIEGKEKIKVMFTDSNGNSTVQATGDIYKHISYLTLPVYLGIKFNKLTINIGAQASYTIVSSGRDKWLFADGVTKWDNKYKNLSIDNYDYGARVGFDYTLTSKFSMEGNYYHGLNNILKSNRVKWKVQQLTMGIRYNLKNPKAKTEEAI